MGSKLTRSGRGQLQYGRRRTGPFTATEVPNEEKPPIIEAYLQRWGGQVTSQLEALPDPVDHLVFKIERSQVSIGRVSTCYTGVSGLQDTSVACSAANEQR